MEDKISAKEIQINDAYADEKELESSRVGKQS
jgi:hypothetical protein